MYPYICEHMQNVCLRILYLAKFLGNYDRNGNNFEWYISSGNITLSLLQWGQQ